MTREEVIERITEEIVDSPTMGIVRIEPSWDKLATFLSELTEGKHIKK